MIEYLVVLVLWAIAFLALTIRLASTRRFLILGGIGMFFLSLVPYAYGRSVTDSAWHDSPLMMVYGFPTILGVLVAFIVILTGVGAGLRRIYKSWGKTN